MSSESSESHSARDFMSTQNSLHVDIEFDHADMEIVRKSGGIMAEKSELDDLERD